MPGIIETFTKWWHLWRHEKGWKPLPELANYHPAELRTGLMNVAKPESRQEGKKAQPISRHPLFPAIVALWFAALFGLGSLMVSPALIERIVSATGLAKVLPMAAPPLGATARILFALALTGLGGLVGLVAGRRVAQTAEEAPARMPFAGLEADGEPEVVPVEERASSGSPRRRRALALPVEDAVPLEEPEIVAPEAEQPPILNLSELDFDGIEAADPVDPLLLAEETYRQPDLEAPEIVAAEWSPAEDEAPVPPTSSDDADEQGPFGRIPEWLEPRQEAHSFSPARWGAAHDEVSQPAAPAPAPESLSNRLFEAYSRSLNEPAETSEVQPLFTACAADTDADSAQETATFEERLQAAERIAGADLEDLSQVELLERLALAMERQRRLRTAATQAEPEDRPISDEVAIAADPTPPSAETIAFPAERPADSILPRLASVSPFTAPLRSVPDTQDLDRDDSAPVAKMEVPTPIPAALRPIGFDAFGHDDADDALPGYVPPRHISLALANPVAVLPEAPAEPENEVEDREQYAAFDTLSEDFDYDEAPEDDEEETVLAKGYSSLLNLSRQSPRQNFVRLDEEASTTEVADDVSEVNGARPFDPPARPDPGETEKALRAALATLQRMSGAA
jgi:hypothetical protein